MYLTILLAIGALAISAVAAYFSVIGLAVIFAASAIPIIIMGATVEFGKITAVAWIHYNWDRATKRLKIIMITCIFIAMVLTSVGVFGFLSKAHVEQTALGDESVAQIERIETEIVRQKSVIERGDNKIIELESTGSTLDNTIEIRIQNEQTRIDAAATRLQPAIDEQNAIIVGQTDLYRDQIKSMDIELDKLQAYIDAGEIKKAQQLIGEKSKGGWGPKTSETARLWRLERQTKIVQLFAKIEDISQNNLAILAARQEISRLRQAQEFQLAESNRLINRLRAQLGNTDATNIDELIDEQYLRISNANRAIESLTNEKYEIEAQFRQLEAEVGPIKYIAEFVYDEKADATLLERAVKWMIILLLLVLDPFAITLVIAATDGYKFNRDDKKRSGLDGSLMYVDDNGKDHIIKLEADLLAEATRYDALMRTLEMRNKDMNELRVSLNEAASQQDVEAVNKLAAELEDAEVDRNNLIQEFEDYRDQAVASSEDLVAERDNLQRELNQLTDEIDIVEKEIEKVPLLELEIKKLTRGLVEVKKNEEILTRQKHMINITAPGNEASLRHKIQLLSSRITSMIELSDFDIESAQELVEVKQQKLDVERRLQELNKKYDDLMK